MFEPLIALLRYVQAALELAVASDAQVGVLLIGALGAAAVVLVVTTWRAVPALVAADPSGAATRLGRPPTRVGSSRRATPTRPGARVRGRRGAASRPRSDPTPSEPARRAPATSVRRSTVRPSRPDGSRIPRPQGHPMDLYAFPPIAALLDGAHALLMALAALLEPLAGAASAAAAVVLVTVLVRAALIPVGISQAKAERTRARLAPRIADLRRRHANDPERLQRETAGAVLRRGHLADGRLPAAAHPGADRRRDLRPLHPADDRRSPERAARAARSPACRWARASPDRSPRAPSTRARSSCSRSSSGRSRSSAS